MINMSGRTTRGRDRSKLSRAELKAYEARRAAERRRIATHTASSDVVELGTPLSVEHSYTMSRDEEFEVIRSDLKRLGIIVAILAVALLGATIVLG
jgi:hypothetical protein